MTPRQSDDAEAKRSTADHPEDNDLEDLEFEPTGSNYYARLKMLQEMDKPLASRMIREARQNKSLTSGAVSANTKTGMTGEAQQAIERARAEAEQSPALEHPAPDTVTELQTIAAQAIDLGTTLAGIHEEDIPLTYTELELAAEGLRDITQRGNRILWELILHGVKIGLINQTQAADLGGESQANVSRRYRKGSSNTGQPE
jgi:hypothetical protein